MKSAKELIEAIDTTSRSLKLDDPEAISKDVVALSQYNMGLGNWLADAMEAERGLDRDLKLARQKIILDLRKTKTAVAEAEAKALMQTEDEWNQLLEVQNAVQLYKIKRIDTQMLVDTIRSRLSVIKEDLRQANE